MVKILHTADLHLAPDAEERIAALETVLSKAEQKEVGLVTIGGDLFDSELAAEQLRETLRETFSDRPYSILTIPGNHDVAAYQSNLFFGDSFLPATDSPFGFFEIKDTRITTLPYTSQATEELLISLRDREPFDGTECLLLHCSLEAPITRNIGDEDERRYFPVKKEELAELGFDYYLSGHYHSPHRTTLSNGGTFLYPGTPASVSRKETGRRRVTYIDTEDGQAVQLEAIDSFHYDSLELRVTPATEDTVLDEIESSVAQWETRDVSPEITITGFTEMSEDEFADAVSNASDDITVSNQTRTVEHILTHPLFEAFQTRLDDRNKLQSIEERADYDIDRFQEDVWEETLEVFADLAAEGILS